MKVVEPCFRVFIKLYRVFYMYLSSLWMKSQSVTIQMKAIEQYFPVVLFNMLCNVVLTFELVDQILKCDY